MTEPIFQKCQSFEKMFRSNDCTHGGCRDVISFVTLDICGDTGDIRTAVESFETSRRNFIELSNLCGNETCVRALAQPKLEMKYTYWDAVSDFVSELWTEMFTGSTIEAGIYMYQNRNQPGTKRKPNYTVEDVKRIAREEI